MRKAIVIPYRDRAEHLERFLKHYGTMFEIFVVEQYDRKPFNRAKLFNVWFLEYGFQYDYFITHDVDMYLDLTKSLISLYDYPENPTHIATRCEQFGYKMPYPDYFGGVTLFNREQFIEIDGFSNEFWSWGAEDDEMLANVNRKYSVNRREAFFKSAPHSKVMDHSNYKRNVERLKSGRSKDDGLSNCRYQVFSCEDKKFYTHLKVVL